MIHETNVLIAVPLQQPYVWHVQKLSLDTHR